ncbi:AzlC family ABC transporter permease [Variovorax boronicumulans]|uniref:AzlC family ABC transporter permease n=1 Tax=Variovorax boronicumulans TaxID=436515 RepID=UPI00278940FC|nr:AzlC family ABC transporter permease [Variovorax boronicumulans]MDQ0042161.1 putative branched-subunit amino acid permease [Variovorax boronicumulans]
MEKSLSAPMGISHGWIAALPFIPKVLVFGLIVGVASKNADWSLNELILAALSINAATAQLAALEFNNSAHIWALIALTIGLNAKHLIFTASLWPYLKNSGKWRAWLAAAMVTDSSWTACHIAAQRGPINVNFILGNSSALTLAWTAGCIAGFQFGAVFTQQMLYRFGLDALVPLSMALLLPIGLRRNPHQLTPIGIGAVVGLAYWWRTDQQAAAVLVAGLAGMAATLWLHRRHKESQA